MKVRRKRDVYQTSLILSDGRETDQDSYPVRVLTENRFERLLDCRVDLTDGELLYCYDITSRQSLETVLAGGDIGRPFLKLLFSGLSAVLKELTEYLLPEDGLLLDLSLIYLEPDRSGIRFCYYPGAEEPFSDAARALGESLLTRLDHKDQDAVVLGYSFYQSCCAETLTAGLFEDLAARCEPENTRAGGNGAKRTGSEQPGPGEAEVDAAAEERILASLFEETEPAEKKKRQFRLSRAADAAGRRPASIVEKIRRFLLSDVKDLSGKKSAQRRKDSAEQIPEMPASAENGWAEASEDLLSPEVEPLDRRLFADAVPEGTGRPGAKREGMKWEEDDSAETVFLGAVSSAAGGTGTGMVRAKLEPEQEGMAEILLTKDRYVIGKSRAAADIVLPFPAVSRVHAVLEWDGSTYVLRDLNSKNGTRLEGKELESERPYPLPQKAEIAFADCGFCFMLSAIQRTSPGQFPGQFPGGIVN